MGRLFSKRRDLAPAQPKEKTRETEKCLSRPPRRGQTKKGRSKAPKADKSFASLFKGCGVWGDAPRPYPGAAEKKNQGNSEASFPAAQKGLNLEEQTYPHWCSQKSRAIVISGLKACKQWLGLFTLVSVNRTCYRPSFPDRQKVKLGKADRQT